MRLWHAALLAAIALASYANSFRAGFAVDNRLVLLSDPRLRVASASNLELIARENYWWPTGQSGVYRPLTTLSYLFNYAVLGNADRPLGYHCVNFGLHVANVLLAWLLALSVWNQTWPAFFTAAIFAVHPVNTESVTNVVGRADLMAGLGVLGGLLLYARSITAEGWRKLPWLAGLLLAALFGVFSKENAVILAGVMALHAFTFRARRRGVLAAYCVVGVALLAMVSVRTMVFARMRAAELPFVDNPLVGADFLTARLTALKVMLKSAALLLWPQSLSPDYSYNQIPLVSLAGGVAALAGIIALLTLVARQYSRNRPAFFFGMFFFVTLLPTANLFKLIGSILAERFLYLPSLGVAGCVVAACRALGRRWSVPALGLIAVALGLRTYARNMDWIDDERLWSKAVRTCPASFKTHQSLAAAWYRKGLTRDNVHAAIREGEQALAIVKDVPDENNSSAPFLYLGMYYRVKGDLLWPSAESLAWLRKSAQVMERGAQVDRAFNEVYRRREQSRGWRPEMVPDAGNPVLYANLAQTYMRLGEHSKATESYLYQRRLQPDNRSLYRELAQAQLAAGKPREAAVALVESVVLGSTPDELTPALELYRQIDPSACVVAANCALVKEHLCAAYDGLARAHLEAHRPDDAQQLRQAAANNGCAAPTKAGSP